MHSNFCHKLHQILTNYWNSGNASATYQLRIIVINSINSSSIHHHHQHQHQDVTDLSLHCTHRAQKDLRITQATNIKLNTFSLTSAAEIWTTFGKITVYLKCSFYYFTTITSHCLKYTSILYFQSDKDGNHVNITYLLCTDNFIIYKHLYLIIQ